MKFSTTAVSGLALCAFLAGVPALAQSGRVDAGGHAHRSFDAVRTG